MKNFLSIDDVCRESGFSRPVIVKEIKNKELKTITIGSRFFIMLEQYDSWLTDKAKRAEKQTGLTKKVTKKVTKKATKKATKAADMSYLKSMTDSGVITNPSVPDSAAHALETQERRNEEWEKLPIHSRVFVKFDNDAKYLSDCLGAIGESLDINLLELLYRTDDMRAIKTMLLDALINELTKGVE